MHSTNGAVRFISDAVVLGRWIYFGSPYNNYLARIPTRLRDVSQADSDAGGDNHFIDDESIPGNFEFLHDSSDIKETEVGENDDEMLDGDSLDMEYKDENRIEL